MPAAPLPSDEAQRVETLLSLKILDTPPEERFDRIARVAKQLFNVPVALVTLIDSNRQWFKSCEGLPIKEMPRGVSFCTYTILQSGVFIIEDAQKDLRFADNPLVTKFPFVRFYAGHPVPGPDGKNVGTLCILDNKPRSFSAVEAEALRYLAGWAEVELNRSELSRALEERKKVNEDLLSKTTDLTLAEHELQAEELELRTLVDQMGDGVFAIDRNSKITFCNGTAATIIGKSESDMQGDLFTDHVHFIHEHDRSDASSFIRDAMIKKEVVSGGRTIFLAMQDGTDRDMSASAAPLLDAAGNVTGAIVAFRSNTADRDQQKVRSEFAYASHQLRTPITKAAWCVEAALDAADLPAARTEMITAQQSLKSITQLADELVTISEIDQGMLSVHTADCAVESIIKKACETVQKHAEAKKITITVAPCAEIHVQTDEHILCDVIVRILENAMMYSSAGSTVTVTAEIQGDALSLQMHDEGIGILEKEQPFVFTKFFRGSNFDTTNIAGAGLGLCICKGYLAILGGKVWFKSKEKEGTTVCVQVPVRGK